MLYRLSDRIAPGSRLFDLLEALPIKLWVVHIGSNNLRPSKGPLGEQDTRKLWLLLRAIFSRSSDDAKILLCGIFERRDMQGGQVSGSNEKLVATVEKLNKLEGRERVFYQAMPSSIDITRHLADQAHLNVAGYRIWDEVLSAKVDELLTN